MEQKSTILVSKTEPVPNAHDKILKEKLKMQVFIIFAIKDNKTYEYCVTKNSVNEIIHEGILSRGKDIMPEIEKSFI